MENTYNKSLPLNNKEKLEVADVFRYYGDNYPSPSLSNYGIFNASLLAFTRND